ncbi:2-phosphosulfolactate phosphatase family protein [Clostridium frigidicarnis]|uniref:Probable 2-phosphosulfolactate phosphatase n=1 Tax=Clostridium frigidicarnis TaxID=84698 RepID=A0A1I0YSF6_9CLOT|nr:2-phosphosulfolactate phosphatase family protein [Clostridium frigidicarnis]SFB15380.1 2-phosphosulfolactate phosphatase [Clostridium frigidicarnis]
MKIDLIISADDISEVKTKGKTVVVIDMLRATSVITTALNNGAKKVIPFLTVEEALEYSKDNRKNFILGGERRAVKIEGFDLSNSPLEYVKELVNDKVVIMTTSNGTRAIKGCENAKNLLIGAMINAKAIAKRIIELDNDVVFVNAGTQGQFSMDDFICAGYMIKLLEENDNVDLTDVAFTAKHIYESHEDIQSFIVNARHYNIIKSLGLEEDLGYCMKKDILDIVPFYENGEIII